MPQYADGGVICQKSQDTVCHVSPQKILMDNVQFKGRWLQTKKLEKNDPL